MLRQFLFGFCAAVLIYTTSAAPAAAQQTDSRSGCSRDVTRHCRAVMDNGDMAVLACLKEHRAKLSKTCLKVLTDNNQ
jgi:hypothetical protein